MPVLTKAKIVDMTTFPVTKSPPQSHRSKMQCVMADLITRGRKRRPKWKQTRGTYYRRRNGLPTSGAYAGKAMSDREAEQRDIDSACAMGFAQEGLYGLRGQARKDAMEAISLLSSEIIHINDQQRWSLDKLVHYLTLGCLPDR